jgi:hypothetical protein
MLQLKKTFFIIFMLLLSNWSHAQYINFSEEPDIFVNDIVAGLSEVGTEPANKIGFDFRSVWASQITAEHKAQIIGITKKFKKRNLKANPFFVHFFGLVTYSITEKGISGEKLTKLLQIIDNSTTYYDTRKLREVLKNLHSFFGRGYLYVSRFNTVKVEGGTFDFEIFEEDYIPQYEEEIPDEELGEEDDIISEDDDDWPEESEDDGWPEESEDDGWPEESEDDGWPEEDDDDGWGDEDDDDGWGDEEEDDGWGDEGDDDGWGNDDYEEEKPAKPVFLRPKFESDFKRDLVAEVQGDDVMPPLVGGIIKIYNADISITSPFDTLRLKNTSGSFIIKTEEFLGTEAFYDWPAGFQEIKGAKVVLKEFTFRTHLPELWTSKAVLLYPNMFQDSLAGVFRYKSKKWRSYDKKYFPQFTSNLSDKEISIPGENVYYKGGLSIIGGKLYGTSISENPGLIKIADHSGHAITSEAVKYVFKDSTIFSHRSSVVIHHGSDSIFHPAVQFDFDVVNRKLILLKEKGAYKHTYYHSSLLDMEFKTDLVQWDLNSDSIHISIMNGRNIIPAVFESEEYFNPITYQKMTGLFGFHPVMVVVDYGRKINGKTFNIKELEKTYPVNAKILHSAIIFLKQNGFIAFDNQTGDITLKRKVYHYALSNAKKKDYDNILISSLSTGKANAIFDIVKEELYVSGVKDIFVTPNLDVRITPDSSKVTLLRGKDMRFNGTVNAGDFQYKGHDFMFEYNQFLLRMPVIDSIRIQIPDRDSTATKEDTQKTALKNHITETSGVLYINKPNNKAGFKKYAQYPYFVSESDAIVYFDSPEILNGAYDRSIKFIIPPFEIDSINRADETGIGFEGRFIGGGILPDFDEKLSIMPDKSLGFKHKIPTEGYALYGGEGVVYNDLSLDQSGLKANGKIDYRTTTIHSDDFIFYMDSVTAIGSGGIIKEGDYDGASYPEAILGAYSMLWLPLKDSMYIENVDEPFRFYNSTASLIGKANITAKGVFGSGTMLSRGSKSVSSEFEFSQLFYSARHAKFEILTDEDGKPAMLGDDISMNFDLTQNIADVHPEQIGVAAISFPYAQMKTSITDAVWYLDSAKITMSKPENVKLESSYFYTTREELDSLAFNASSATYDINSFELNVKGIPYIKVADAEIIPDNNETTILANSELQQFKNAKLKIDTLNEYHNLYDGDIKILSRNKFEGSATYELVTAANDTFAIKFESFELQEFPIGKDETIQMTVSGGSVAESQNLQMAPGFLFKGSTTMYADKKKLELNGLTKLNIKSIPDYDHWIQFAQSGDSTDVSIDLASALTEEGSAIDAGLIYDNISYNVYSSFVQNRNRAEDVYLFKAEGALTYDYTSDNYFIETPSKSALNSYAGKTFIYNDQTKSVIFEGPIDFTKNTENFSLKAAVLGSAKPDSSFYAMDAFLAFQMSLHKSVTDAMSFDVLDIIERLGADVAHSNSVEVIYKLSNMVGDTPAKEYENGSLSDYIPMFATGAQLEKTIVISNVDLRWSPNQRSWYNTSKLGFSNILKNDINASIDGFIEIKKSDTGGDIIHLFLQVAPATWFYFGYNDGRLSMFSSNPDFNAMVTEHSNIGKTAFGEYTTVIGDEVEVVKFINDFRFNHYGIAEEYNLEFPSDNILDDNESFDTIEDGEEENVDTELEEDEDDGF